MKTTRLITLITALLLIISLQVSGQKTSNIKTTIFNVSMHCTSCKDKIEKNIAFEKGVKDMVVNLDQKTVSITYNTTKTSEEKLIAAFKKIGYEASVKSVACCDATQKKDCNTPCKDKPTTVCVKPDDKKCINK